MDGDFYFSDIFYKAHQHRSKSRIIVGLKRNKGFRMWPMLKTLFNRDYHYRLFIVWLIDIT